MMRWRSQGHNKPERGRVKRGCDTRACRYLGGMSDTSTAASAASAPTTVRLPLAELPATVLPGAVITLALVTDQARRAVEAAKGTGDGRVLLRAGDGHL